MDQKFDYRRQKKILHVQLLQLTDNKLRAGAKSYMKHNKGHNKESYKIMISSYWKAYKSHLQASTNFGRL